MTKKDVHALLAEAVATPHHSGQVGDAVQIVWDRGEHHFEIDFRPGMIVEWFYQNTRTGEYTGSDE